MMPNQNETFELKKSYTSKFLEQRMLIQFDPMFHLFTPRKTAENQRFSDVFRGYRNGAFGLKCVKKLEN